MDPLSATASAVAFATVVIATTKQLKEIHGASEELQDVVRDVELLKSVLEEVEDVLEERCACPVPIRGTDRVCHLIQAIKDRLEALEQLIDDRLVRSRTSQTDVKAARLSWMRFKSRVQRRRQELLACRESLTALCTALHMYDPYQQDQPEEC